MSVSLTPNFTQEDLGVAGQEQRLIDNAQFLCQNVLEPVLAHYGHSVRVHDGYRDPQHNARVGGKAVSFHLYEGGDAASDIDVLSISISNLFEWLCKESHLLFDKVIMEKNAAGVPVCVHIQIDRLNPPRRQAFIGGTGACEHYDEVPVY